VVVVDVDPVGLESVQAGFDGRRHIDARPALDTALMVKPEFSGEDQIFAAVAKGRAQETLGAAKIAIGVGGIDEIDACLDRGIDNGLGLLKVEPTSEIVASEAECGNGKTGAAECALDHRSGSAAAHRAAMECAGRPSPPHR
jgi:hypothetical protein